jgi:DNA polymerase-1
MIKMTDPTHIVVLFDGEHDNPRIELSAEYKANRPNYADVPEEENPFSQLADIYAALDCMGINILRLPMAKLTARWRPAP